MMGQLGYDYFQSHWRRLRKILRCEHACSDWHQLWKNNRGTNLGFLRLRFPSLGKDAWVPQKWMDLVVRARHGFDPSTGRTCRWICSLLEKEVPKKVKAESEREAGGGGKRDAEMIGRCHRTHHQSVVVMASSPVGEATTAFLNLHFCTN